MKINNIALGALAVLAVAACVVMIGGADDSAADPSGTWGEYTVTLEGQRLSITGTATDTAPARDGAPWLNDKLAFTALDIRNSNLTRIPDSAFSGCSNLHDVYINNGHLEYIGAWAFKDTALSTVTFPNSLTAVGSYAFTGTSVDYIDLRDTSMGTVSADIGGHSLVRIFAPSGAKISNLLQSSAAQNQYIVTKTTDSYEFVLNGPNRTATWTASQTATGAVSIDARNDMTNLSSGLTSAVIGEGITSITGFRQSGVRSVSLPSTLDTIGQTAFYGCTSLTDISIPSNVTSLGSNAFGNCSMMSSAIIKARVNIPSECFKNCSGLANVYVNCSAIGSRAFANCGTIDTFIISGTPNITAYAFESTTVNKILNLGELVLVPGASDNGGIASNPNVEITNGITAPSFITKERLTSSSEASITGIPATFINLVPLVLAAGLVLAVGLYYWRRP